MSKKDSSVAEVTQKRKPGRPAKITIGKAPLTLDTVLVDPVVLDTYGRAELHKKAEKLFGKPAKATHDIEKLIIAYDERIDVIMNEVNKLQEVRNQLADERNILDNLMDEMARLGKEFEIQIHAASN